MCSPVNIHCYSVHKQVIHKNNALPVVSVGKWLPRWIINAYCNWGLFALHGSLQQPHSKSHSECRNTGLEEMVSVLCWSEMFKKFMGGFNCEESVIKGHVVCCSAANDLIFHYNPEFFQVGYALVKSLNPGTQFDQNWHPKTFNLFTIQWIFKVKEDQSTVILGHFLKTNKYLIERII